MTVSRPLLGSVSEGQAETAGPLVERFSTVVADAPWVKHVTVRESATSERFSHSWSLREFSNLWPSLQRNLLKLLDSTKLGQSCAKLSPKSATLARTSLDTNRALGHSDHVLPESVNFGPSLAPDSDQLFCPNLTTTWRSRPYFAPHSTKLARFRLNAARHGPKFGPNVTLSQKSCTHPRRPQMP